MTRSVARHPLILLIGVVLLLGATIAMVSVAGGATASAPAPPTQIPYSHQVHVQKAGMQCLFCHSDAIRSPQASLPSLQSCMICHAYMSVEEESQGRVDQLIQAYENGVRVQWPDVYKQPDFVYFNHSRHVMNGVACQTCHGDVDHMDVVEKTVEMNMRFCLRCHREYIDQNPDMSEARKARLTDCLTCHK